MITVVAVYCYAAYRISGIPQQPRAKEYYTYHYSM